MDRELRGVLGVLDSKGVLELRRSVGIPADAAAPEMPDIFAFVHLYGPELAQGREHKVVCLTRLLDGTFVAEALRLGDGSTKASPPRRFTLKPEIIGTVASGWSGYRGEFSLPESGIGDSSREHTSEVLRGEVFELDRPYTPGLFTMTSRVMGDRLLAGGVSTLRPTARDPDATTMYCRLPKGYKQGVAAGLLVWCDASPSGRPPQTFADACDALGFVIAGASGAGNDRPVVDRYQLALDVLATVSSRYRIDPNRVYTSGISGGGRVCSTLAACFPDVFAGTAPIVGLACFENVPSVPGHVWPSGFRKPPTGRFAQLKTRRIAAITGEQDFNFVEITRAARIYEQAKCQIRVFSTPEMGHQMPTPQQLGEALRWIDEPAAVARGGAIVEARRRLSVCEHGSEGERSALLEVMTIAPWSEPAWEAAARLPR